MKASFASLVSFLLLVNAVLAVPAAINDRVGGMSYAKPEGVNGGSIKLTTLPLVVMKRSSAEAGRDTEFGPNAHIASSDRRYGGEDEDISDDTYSGGYRNAEEDVDDDGSA